MPKFSKILYLIKRVHTNSAKVLAGGKAIKYVLKQDVWQFNVCKGKHTTKVCVHLDLTEEPTQDVIVKDLVRYISLMEEIHKNCA